MCISANSVSCGNFVHIRPIPLGIDKSVLCNYCVETINATHYVYSFDAACDFMATCSCNDCTQGWREIADQENKQVV